MCEINGEMLEAWDEIVVKWLHRIVSRAWTGGKVSHVWRKALVFPVLKKGSKFLCN